MDGNLVLALVSTGTAVLNDFDLLITWMRYKNIRQVIFQE